MNAPRTASRKTKVGQGKAVTSLKHTWLEQVAVDSGLPPLAMRAAVRIWSHWNAKTQTARPSYMRIAEDLAASEWGVIKAVKALIERGHLRIAVAGKQGSGHSNAYALVLKGLEKPEAGDRVPEREKPQQAEGFQETEIPQQPLGFSEKVKPQRLAGKNPNGRWDEPLNPTPIVPERSGEAGAASAEPSANAPDTQWAERFLRVMPHRPSHVPTATPQLMRALEKARASGALPAEILAGAERCAKYQARHFGEGPYAYAPTPEAFLRKEQWRAAWDDPPQRKPKRRPNREEKEEQQQALLRQIREGRASSAPAAEAAE